MNQNDKFFLLFLVKLDHAAEKPESRWNFKCVGKFEKSYSKNPTQCCTIQPVPIDRFMQGKKKLGKLRTWD